MTAKMPEQSWSVYENKASVIARQGRPLWPPWVNHEGCPRGGWPKGGFLTASLHWGEDY
jgi:hypothetical protein